MTNLSLRKKPCTTNLVVSNYEMNYSRSVYGYCDSTRFLAVYIQASILSFCNVPVSAWMLLFEMRGPDKHGKKRSYTYRTMPALRKVENLIREFLSMQILHKEMMKIVGIVLFGVHAAFSQLCLYCNFVVIQNWNILPRSTKVSWEYS